MSGDGRGVTSGIALSIGEENAEFGAEVIYEPAKLLILGVRGGGPPMRFDGRIVGSVDFREEKPLGSVAGVREAPGMTSVCRRNPALKGLA